MFGNMNKQRGVTLVEAYELVAAVGYPAGADNADTRRRLVAGKKTYVSILQEMLDPEGMKRTIDAVAAELGVSA